ncbi:O-antigen ligase domain-containing protein [Wenzhouxiangella sp. 15181]|nr:O-antigen ligase domain-containing protein [Wenzhouxiangella sp. 15181]RFP69003.1 O-antigen ligase domain-containing protein [Wenzhouxiangella sp. 15190]
MFAQVLMIYSSILLGYALFFNPKIPFWGAFAFSVMSISVAALSLSRSGVIGICITHMALFWYWMMQGKRLRAQRFAVVTTSVILAVASASLFVSVDFIPGLNRFVYFGLEFTAISSRLEQYSASMNLLSNAEILAFGVGSGQFYEALADNNIPISYRSWLSPEMNFGSVHNWALQLVTEHGVAVLGLYIYALYKSIRKGIFLGRSNTRKGKITAAMAIILAMLFLVPLSFGTGGATPWLLTPVIIMLAFIHNEYDNYLKHVSNCVAFSACEKRS